jgi:hypothetical protein
VGEEKKKKKKKEQGVVVKLLERKRAADEKKLRDAFEATWQGGIEVWETAALAVTPGSTIFMEWDPSRRNEAKGRSSSATSD